MRAILPKIVEHLSEKSVRNQSPDRIAGLAFFFSPRFCGRADIA
jgi:hypothetical protein